MKLPLREQRSTYLSPGKTTAVGALESEALSHHSHHCTSLYLHRLILTPLTAQQKVRAYLLDLMGGEFTQEIRITPRPRPVGKVPLTIVVGRTTLLSTGNADLWQILLQNITRVIIAGAVILVVSMR